MHSCGNVAHSIEVDSSSSSSYSFCGLGQIFGFQRQSHGSLCSIHAQKAHPGSSDTAIDERSQWGSIRSRCAVGDGTSAIKPSLEALRSMFWAENVLPTLLVPPRFPYDLLLHRQIIRIHLELTEIANVAKSGRGISLARLHLRR